MTKKSDEAKRVAALPPKPAPEKTVFTPEECIEIREMQRLINARKFEARMVKGNTALVPRGQEVCGEIEAIARLLENEKNHWVGARLLAHGYPHDFKCEIDLTTGEVKVISDPPKAEPVPVPAEPPKVKEESKQDDVGPQNSPEAA